MNLWATKSIAALRAEAEATNERSLKRALGALNLTMLGIGAIIGAGIFVLTGLAAALHAGPAVPLSFVVAAIACGLAGLCYAEMASTVPVAGSAYTYSYATMGEFARLDHRVGPGAGVRHGRGHRGGGLVRIFREPARLLRAAPSHRGHLGAAPLVYRGRRDRTPWRPAPSPAGTRTGSLFNLPAVLIVLLATTILVIGIKESAKVNNLIVILKLAVVLLFILFGLQYVNPDNWKPFIPPNTGTFGEFGWSGVFRGAGLIFFAYIGFDAVSTAAQEAKNPQRDMPTGILGSLVHLYRALRAGVAHPHRAGAL